MFKIKFRTYITAILFFSVAQLWAAKNEYRVDLIADSLRKNATSVVRFSEISCHVTGAGKAEYRVHRVITVLSEPGSAALNLAIYYNKFTRLTNFSADFYDQDGKLLSKKSKDDMADLAVIDGYSLFSDLREGRLKNNIKVYPVTIEYDLTLKMTGFLDYPKWRPLANEQSVQSSSYTVVLPDKFGIKYYPTNMPAGTVPQIEKNKGLTSYTWRLQNVRAIVLPDNSYAPDYFLPGIHFSPDTFEIDGHVGSWAGWNTFGLAMYQMWKNAEGVPNEVADKAKEIVKDAQTDREKAELLYTWFQHEFHYVSVQIGIGYLVPFDVATVNRVKYGDCKALTNYMVALMNVVGIKAAPALINAGANEHAIDTLAPGNYFNHAILYADLNDGPLWLECTSNSTPFGQLGTFTENRYALVFDKTGGRIMKTPESDARPNVWSDSTYITINNSLTANITDRIGLSGEYRAKVRATLLEQTQKDRNKYIFEHRKFGAPDNYVVDSFMDVTGKVSFSITGKSEKIYEFKSGNKVFFPSTLIKSWYSQVPIDSTQKVDLLLDFPFVKTEQLSYKLPEGDKVSLPADFVLENGVIRFTRSCKKATDNTVSIVTELTLKKHIVPPVQIMLLKESLLTINKYLQQRLIVDVN